MALTAPTDFVWLIDDDMIPGNKYLGQLMHAAGTELLGSSLLGSIGRVLPRPGRDMSLVSYRKVRCLFVLENRWVSNPLHAVHVHVELILSQRSVQMFLRVLFAVVACGVGFIV